jgi:hypothetical protein
LSLETLWKEDMDIWVLGLAKEEEELERETRTSAALLRQNGARIGPLQEDSMFSIPSNSSWTSPFQMLLTNRL